MTEETPPAKHPTVPPALEHSMISLSAPTLINELTGNRTPVDLRPARTWDRSGKRFGSTEKSRTALGFEASVMLRDGLTKTIDWTRAHLATIQRCIAQHDLFMKAAK